MQSEWITWIKPHPDGYKAGELSLVRPYYADRMISGGYAMRCKPHMSEDSIVEDAMREKGDYDEKEAPIVVHNHYYTNPPDTEEE